MAQLLTYGLKEGKLIHVSKVANGLACKCICANCKHPLVAKNNPANKKLAHFAHHTGNECAGPIETALHLLAKTILKETKQLLLPAYHYDYNQSNRYSIFRKSEFFKFDEIFLEQPVFFNGNRITPDAIGIKNKKQIFIEFANTHFIDFPKKAKLEQMGIPCIEIDLREQDLNEEQLKDFFISENCRKYWVTNPRMDERYIKYKEGLLKKEKLRQEQLLKEEQRRKEEEKRKYHSFKNSIKHKVLYKKHSTVYKCPKELNALAELKSETFYTHEILKRIIDGEYWNGEFYGFPPNGTWIFLKKEKIMVYPSQIDAKNLNLKKNRWFYAGLKTIKTKLQNSEFGNCSNCRFFAENLSYKENEYVVCSHF